MRTADYAGAPKLAKEAVLFLIPSVGPGTAGRVMTFRSVSDLRRTKRFFDGLGQADPLYFTWTYANVKRRVLLQMNGALGNKRAAAYGAVIKSL
jgi:hypothetical protein